MVRAAVAIAIVAFGAATVLAQSIDNDFDLETREYIAEVEAREYIDEVDARDFLEEYADIDARDEEVFGGLESREIDEVFEYLRDVSATPKTPTTTGAPTKTVTKTHLKKAKSTACSKKQLKTIKQNHRVANAKKTLLDAQKKAPKTLKDKLKVRRARKLLAKHLKKQARLKKIRARKAAKKARKAKKAQRAKSRAAAALKKAGVAVPTATGTSTAAASTITPPPDSKNKKNNKKDNKKSTKVGKDGVTTVHVTSTAAPTSCKASAAFRKSLKKLPRELDEELESVFARENEFDELD